MTNNNEQPVPISELRCEGITDHEIEKFIRDRGVDIILDDIGRRAITRDLARVMLAERAAANAALEAQLAARTERNAARDAERTATDAQRQAARQAAEAAIREAFGDGATAVDVMRFNEFLEAEAEADVRTAERLDGGLHYHRLHRPENDK